MTCTYAPLLELGVDDSVGEALAADTDALEYTVTLQLVQDQLSIHHTWQHRAAAIHTLTTDTDHSSGPRRVIGPSHVSVCPHNNFLTK